MQKIGLFFLAIQALFFYPSQQWTEYVDMILIVGKAKITIFKGLKTFVVFYSMDFSPGPIYVSLIWHLGCVSIGSRISPSLTGIRTLTIGTLDGPDSGDMATSLYVSNGIYEQILTLFWVISVNSEHWFKLPGFHGAVWGSLESKRFSALEGLCDWPTPWSVCWLLN